MRIMNYSSVLGYPEINEEVLQQPYLQQETTCHVFRCEWGKNTSWIFFCYSKLGF